MAVGTRLDTDRRRSPDHYSDFGSTAIPRLALVWDAAYNLTRQTLGGLGFRPPRLLDVCGEHPVANGSQISNQKNPHH